MEEKVSFAHHKVMKYIIREAMTLMLIALCGILSDFVPSLLCKVISLFTVSFALFMNWKGGQLPWMIIRSVPALLSHKQNHLFISPCCQRPASRCGWHALELCSAEPVQLYNLACL